MVGASLGSEPRTRSKKIRYLKFVLEQLPPRLLPCLAGLKNDVPILYNCYRRICKKDENIGVTRAYQGYVEEESHGARFQPGHSRQITSEILLHSGYQAEHEKDKGQECDALIPAYNGMV